MIEEVEGGASLDELLPSSETVAARQLASCGRQLMPDLGEALLSRVVSTTLTYSR